MRTPLLRSLVLSGLLATPLSAQIHDDGARMERVADGVYVIIHDNATDEWPHGNTGVIVGQDAVAVIDATYLPSRARADIALIRQVTPKPVRYLIYTHWHFDHNNGGIAYREAFPDVAIVSQRDNARFIELNGIWWSKMSIQPNSTKRAGLARMEEDVARGADSSGRALSADERTMHQGHIRQRRAELEELKTLKVVTPDLLFDGALTLPLGRRVLELRDRGRPTARTTSPSGSPRIGSCSAAISWWRTPTPIPAPPGQCPGPASSATWRRSPSRCWSPVTAPSCGTTGTPDWSGR